MFRKIFLPSLLAVLAFSFWLSADFKQIAAGVAIFLFGANLGTTTGAWLIADFGLKVKISAYAMPSITRAKKLCSTYNKSG